ncbi:MAG: hypothetical protein D6743_06970 [Calditrichaeota bacterium]|nr:MAG: hypothetical protein D6743_06970 [Calditrichota bacterium]
MRLVDLYRPVRRFSYPLTSVLILALEAHFFLLKSFSFWGLGIVAGTAALLGVLWLRLRPGQSMIVSAGQVYSAIGNGRPTFLNIYSNY